MRSHLQATLEAPGRTPSRRGVIQEQVRYPKDTAAGCSIRDGDEAEACAGDPTLGESANVCEGAAGKKVGRKIVMGGRGKVSRARPEPEEEISIDETSCQVVDVEIIPTLDAVV